METALVTKCPGGMKFQDTGFVDTVYGHFGLE